MPPRSSKAQPIVEDEDEKYSIGRDFFGKKKSETPTPAPWVPIPHAVDQIMDLPYCGVAPPGLASKLEEFKSVASYGFGVLVYGMGSKIDIMKQLLEDHLKDYTVVRIQGFQQAVSISRCLAAVLTSVLKRPLPRSQSVQDLAEEISKFAKHGDAKRLAWIVDSIDAAPVRDFQEVFATLSKTGLFFASADHFRFPLLWSEATRVKFNFFHYELNTLEDYRREVIGVHGACLPAWCGLGVSEESSAAKSLAVVLRSLTPHHTLLVKLVASLQLKQTANYIKASDLLKQCRKEMLATNHAKLKSLLHELLDHAIIKTKKEAETGNEIFFIAGDRAYLEKIVTGEAMVESARLNDTPMDVDEVVRGG